ncbi:carbamoyltransferase HypF [Ekhidna sp.]|uniref:carbamoyltransferase HypF n=1 Tax=Ekhidna sp. TaxID=2608089 RepID=UPI00329804FA
MNTYHIHIKGRVQGVGFRPFVFQTAKELEIKGWVCNATNGLHIRCNAEKKVIDQFYRNCLSNKPNLAVISDASITQMDAEVFTDFEIVESQGSSLELSISPDFALCRNCRNELHSLSNSRHQYPFITCTHCGPRYSILTGLPYDRPFTSMSSFEMCQSCESEYTNPLDRRYYSQTNSCQSCGIQIQVYDGVNPTKAIEEQDTFHFINKKLKQGKIIAVKGIGGFLLLCDASSLTAIKVLRERKQRPSKPFAVLYPNIRTVEDSFVLSSEERELLSGSVSPIVLLPANNQSSLPMKSVAPGLDKVGVMIPYAPILEIISSRFNEPLIATSANLSGAPIVHQEEDISKLAQLADFIVDHNRPISFPQDDSVTQFSPVGKQKIILRRSRGMAPSVFAGASDAKKDMLALGAEMKGTFGLLVNSNTYISQYLGNLSHYDNQVQFEKTLNNFLELVQPELQQIIVDKHPGYFSHQIGQSLAKAKRLPIVEVQHHEAHFGAMLNEKNLLEEDKVLGVIWDGTGHGSDGHSWGGEFFDYSESTINRMAHLAYFNNLANERMAIDNRLCALSLIGSKNCQILEHHFKPQEWDFYTKALDQSKAMTSSMGRVFDAVAFLLGLATENTYEGQSAMLLEQDAIRTYTKHHSLAPYQFIFHRNQISLTEMFDEMLTDIENKIDGVSMRFHLTLVQLIETIATNGNYERIAFSGGVFQNGLLVDLITSQLSKDFQLYFHNELSPNDENIAYGQLACAKISTKKENLKQLELCV